MFAFGNDFFTEAITQALSVSKERAQALKSEQGLIGEDSKAVFDALSEDCTALVHHINEEYITWHTAHKALPPLEHIYLTGSGSVLKGLDEYISVELRVPVTVANVWGNCLSFDEYVPTVPQNEAVKYASAIGVALISNDMSNIVPPEHKQIVQRKQVAGMTGKIIVSFILGAIVGFVIARVIALPSVHAEIIELLHKIQARW
jgi:hypothetical protein